MSENNQQISQNPNLEKENRKEKINILRNMGINPFPNSYEVTYKSKDIIEKFDELEKNQTEVSIAGRIMLYRIMGKSSFLTIKILREIFKLIFKEIKSETIFIIMYSKNLLILAI